MIYKIIFLGLVSLINIALIPFIFFIDNQFFLKFLYLTIINYTICTFFFISRLIFEIWNYFKRKRGRGSSEELCQNNFFIKFLVGHFSKFSFSLCLTVCQVYWLLVLGGEKLMKFPEEDFFVQILSVYLHLIIGVFILVDNFFMGITPNKKEYRKDFVLYIFLQVGYSVLLTFLAKNFEECLIYPFLALDYSKIFAINLVNLFAFKNSYEFYHFSRKNNKKKEPIISESNISSTEFSQEFLKDQEKKYFNQLKI